MWVTLFLMAVLVLLLAVAAALTVSGHRKMDDALKSLASAFKFD